MYFKEFPTFLYDFKYGNSNSNKTSLVKDITRNIRFRRDILSTITMYDEYDIEDGETPEIIAEKIYGNPEYHWIILLANNRYDYVTDFPLDEVSLVKHIVAKYGAQRYSTHHYEKISEDEATRYVVNSDYPGAYTVSNDEWERRLNEEKRRIKIISPSLVSSILKNYKDLL
jgi:hypothetical protein